MAICLLRKGVKEFINNEVKPKYFEFDEAHDIEHFNFVTQNCVDYGWELIKQGINIDLEIAYVVGALHDVGLINGRYKHATSSANFVRENLALKKLFNQETIELIADAVEDHSAHLKYEPRNIYGKLVADADRNNTIDLVFSRPIKYELKNGVEERESVVNNTYEFVQSKFGRNGYIKYWLNIPQAIQAQQQVWEMLDNEEECKNFIRNMLDQIQKENNKNE